MINMKWINTNWIELDQINGLKMFLMESKKYNPKNTAVSFATGISFNFMDVELLCAQCALHM